MSEECGLKAFERFRIVLPGNEDASDAEERFSNDRPVQPSRRTFAARVSEPVLDEPGGYTWLGRAEQTLVFVKRLYQTRA
jgi:hypothetical protein